MESPIAALKEQFRKVFGAGETVHVIRAPGRVNLIGEHTDYNDGFVCPMAIEAQVLFACRARQDALVRITSPEFDRGISEFSVGKKIERGTPAWSNYCRGVAAALVGEGVPLCGMDLLISSTLPVGGGLSSSAALEVGTALCFLNLAGRAMEQMPLALLCQKAEHEYALVPCGIMDQTIVVAAQAGAAMLLDCRRLTTGAVPIDAADLRVVIVNSMVKHELASGEYAVRRRQCQAAVAFFQKENPAIKALRDVTLKDLEGARGRLDDLTLRRARHVVTENLRTVQAAACLGQRKYQQA